MRKEQERFGIQEQRLRYSARVMFEGKIVNDNLFPSRDEALEKATQIEALISKGVFAPGKMVSAIDTFEEANRGLEQIDITDIINIKERK